MRKPLFWRRRCEHPVATQRASDWLSACRAFRWKESFFRGEGSHGGAERGRRAGFWRGMHFEQAAPEGERLRTHFPLVSRVFFFYGSLKTSRLCFPPSPCAFFPGKVGVSRQVEGMVVQVSASGAAEPQTMKTTTTCRLLPIEPNRTARVQPTVPSPNLWIKTNFLMIYIWKQFVRTELTVFVYYSFCSKQNFILKFLKKTGCFSLLVLLFG